MARALILVDIQNDFMQNGALPVEDGDAVVPVANRLQADHDRYDLVVATQDWHPSDHRSFAEQHEGHEPGDVIKCDGLPQILWPVHCVQDTSGAAFHDDLARDRIAAVFHKGTDPLLDSYSGFFDNGHRRATGLGAYLQEQGVGTVCIVGLATDYCVKFTALDAAGEGFETHVLLEGCRAVNLEPGDEHRAIDQMRAVGVTVQ